MVTLSPSGGFKGNLHEQTGSILDSDVEPGCFHRACEAPCSGRLSKETWAMEKLGQHVQSAYLRSVGLRRYLR